LAHRHADVARALLDRDPGVRAGALQVVAGAGLRRWATLLADQARLLERDDRTALDEVRAAELAWLITVCQWEPADDPTILQLRLWAKRYHDRRGEVPAPPAANEVDARDIVGTASPLVTASERALGERVLEVRFWPSPPPRAVSRDAGCNGTSP
jgi:hypothetical protein